MEICQHFICFWLTEKREIYLCFVGVFGLGFVSSQTFYMIGSLSSEFDSLSSTYKIFKANWFYRSCEGFGCTFIFWEHHLFINIMKSQIYTNADIEKLYIQIANQKDNPNVNTLKDSLASISRILVWDDQHQADLFDFICQVKMLELLLDLFGSVRDREIVNSILGFFTILLSNLNRQPSLNYLLSHGVTGCLTMAKFGNMNNEIADYYINFLKVLSRKINQNNLHLFFNERYPTFPILSQTIRFFNHPQSLVRTTCRNIILTFAKLKSPLVDEFMSNFPFAAYYIHQSNFIKEYWCITDKIIKSKEDNHYQLAHLETLFQDHQQILIFIDDLLSLQQPGVVQCFISAFLNQCLSPLIKSLDTQAKQCFSIQLCMYILIVLFKTFSSPFVADTLALIVFGKYYTKSLATSLFQPVPCLLSYDKKWKFKGFWDSHQDKIRMHCSQNYGKFNSNNQKVQKQLNITEKTSNKVDTRAIFGITNNFYERQIQKVETIFGLSILTTRQQGRSVGGQELRQIFASLNQKGLDIQQCEINSISNAISSYLTSKDDSLVMLTLSLFSTVIQNKCISPSVLNFCKLSLQPLSRDFQSIIKIQKLLINSIKIFSVDPPCFRLCTYLQASDLIKKLSHFYKMNQLPLSTDVLVSLKTGLQVAIDRIRPYLFSGREWQNIMTMYLQVTRYYSKRRFKTLKTYGFIPTDEVVNSTKQLATQYIYDNFPKEFEHQIARDFWIYLLIKDLMLQFNSLYLFLKIDKRNVEPQGFKYEQGKTYVNMGDQRIYLEYKMKMQDKYCECALVLMTNYFVLLRENVVERRVSYDECMPLMDKSDPRKLFLSGQKQTMWLQLKDGTTSQALLKHLQEGRSVLMRFKLSQMVKQIEQFQLYTK